jgi:hypothetical protein
MGRKFSGGGTAGGGRSGRGGGVTYTRVIPRFLKDFVQLDDTERGEPGPVNKEEEVKADTDDPVRKQMVGEASVHLVEEGLEGELTELRRAGFRVDAEEATIAECSKAHVEGHRTSGVAFRSIEKLRSRHVQKNASSKPKPSAHFSVCNSNTLSFAEANGASSSSEGS